MNRTEHMIVDKLFEQTRKTGWEFIGVYTDDVHFVGITQGEAVTLLHSLDMADLRFHKGPWYTIVHLVCGNSGWDVINDYGMAPGFEKEVMNEVDAYAETFEPGN